MARVTLDELRGRNPAIDRARMEATTEDDIRRHAAEDGEPAEGDLPAGLRIVAPARLRLRLGLSQAVFAQAIQVPLKTVQNWEQGRTPPDPAARTLLALVAADPGHVLGLLGWVERSAVSDGEGPPAKGRSAGRWVRRHGADGAVPKAEAEPGRGTTRTARQPA